MEMNVDEKYEEKRHIFRIPSEEFGREDKKIYVEYGNKLHFLIASERGRVGEDEGDYEELREYIRVSYCLGDSSSGYSREHVAFEVTDKNYDEIHNHYGGAVKSIDDRVRAILLKELPEYATKILPKSK